MQMLLETSYEHGKFSGLGLIKGDVREVPKKSNDKERKIPHIGWNAISRSENGPMWENSCLEKIDEGSFVYFVHSFMARPHDKRNILAKCEYEGADIVAAVKKDNVTGLQFHPEKSGELGLNILRNFATG